MYKPPKAKAGEGGSNYPPFLKAEDLSYTEASDVKIVEVRETPDAEYSDFAVDVNIVIDGKKEVRSIGCKLNSLNHQRIEEETGFKTGAMFQVIAKRSKKKGYKDFVAVI